MLLKSASIVLIAGLPFAKRPDDLLLDWRSGIMQHLLHQCHKAVSREAHPLWYLQSECPFSGHTWLDTPPRLRQPQQPTSILHSTRDANYNTTRRFEINCVLHAEPSYSTMYGSVKGTFEKIKPFRLYCPLPFGSFNLHQANKKLLLQLNFTY